MATIKVDQASLAISNYPQLNLLLYDDDDNHLRIYYAYSDASHYHFGINYEIGQVFNSYGVGLDLGNEPFYIRVIKEDNLYTVFYSTDGTNFISPVAPIIFGDSTPTSIGFAAMVDPTQTSTFLIDSFEVDDMVMVPEPVTIVLFITGLVGFMIRVNRKQ